MRKNNLIHPGEILREEFMQCHLVNQFQIKIQWFSFRESHCFFRQKLKKYYENS